MEIIKTIPLYPKVTGRNTIQCWKHLLLNVGSLLTTEVSIFNIINETQAGSDDAQIIKSFIRKHVDTSLTVPETVSKIEIELQNFMYGCGDMDVQCDDTRPSKLPKNNVSSPCAAGSSKGKPRRNHGLVKIKISITPHTAKIKKVLVVMRVRPIVN